MRHLVRDYAQELARVIVPGVAVLARAVAAVVAQVLVRGAPEDAKADVAANARVHVLELARMDVLQHVLCRAKVGCYPK